MPDGSDGIAGGSAERTRPSDPASPAEGEAARLMRRLGPAECPLGAYPAWPAALRDALDLLLPSRAQIVVFWGEDCLAFYNDAFAATMGRKHPGALGRPAREGWGEMWEALAPLVERVRRTGETHEAGDHHLLADRQGYLEETFLDLSLSAVRRAGEILGVMAVVAETTGRVLADRRLRALRAAGLHLAEAATEEAACAAALASMAEESPRDLPWARILLDGGDGLREVATHGADEAGADEAGADASGEEALLSAARAVLRDATPREAPGRFLLPIMAGGGAAGVLVAGLNPHQRLAGHYGSYLGLAAGQVSLAVTRLRREAETRRADALLRESEARFRTVADHAPVMIWVADAGGRCTYLNDLWYAFTGQTPGEGLGMGWLGAVHPADREAVRDAFARGRAARAPVRAEYRLRTADGRHAWVIDAATPRLDGEGDFTGYIGSVLDISERHRDEEARELVARELSHRIKNIFMVTGGLAALTARGDPVATDFAARLQARLRALSLAHDLVRPGAPSAPPGGTGDGGTVHGLIQLVLAPYADAGSGRVALEGEDLPVGQAAATALALVLHEQATNAVKYGALSAPAGRLRIVTRVEGNLLRLEWQEAGGPPVPGPPAHRGFGTALVARSLGGMVQGGLEHDWLPGGLVVRLAMPVEALAR